MIDKTPADWRERVVGHLNTYDFHIRKGFEVTKNQVLPLAPLVENKEEVLNLLIGRMMFSVTTIVTAIVDSSEETEKAVIDDMKGFFADIRRQDREKAIAANEVTPLFRGNEPA